MTSLQFAPIGEADADPLVEVFNQYIREGEAAFLDEPVTITFFERMRPVLAAYPSFAVRETDGTFVGFGLLRPHNPLPAFRATAELSAFLAPGWTGRGIGSELLSRLEDAALARGIRHLLAAVSSRNDGSLRFHERHGFLECGRFRGVGVRHGRHFDLVWLQKDL